MGKPRRTRICSSRAHSHQPSQLHRLQSDTAAGGVSEFPVSKPDASVPHRANVGEEENQSRGWRARSGRGSIRSENRSPGHSLTRFAARAADVFSQRGPASPDAATRSRRISGWPLRGSIPPGHRSSLEETTFLLAVQTGASVASRTRTICLDALARARPGRPGPNQRKVGAQFGRLFSYSTDCHGVPKWFIIGSGRFKRSIYDPPPTRIRTDLVHDLVHV
jgi:hypothetical protein